MVMEPTRPHSIKKASNSLDTIPTPGVIPRVNPTVATAETDSNSAVSRGIFSTAEITTETVTDNSR